MVLVDLGRRINSAFAQLNKAPVIDDKALDSLLKEVASALLESDVNVKLVAGLRQKVKAKVKTAIESGADKGKDLNRKNIIQKAIFDELVQLVDPGVEPYKPKKGHPNVIMAVGLQGNGKTTTCTKLAVHYQRRGFKSCIVCADTFRAGAFDQTRQSATKAKVPYFGSYTETDPVSIAAQGVTKFKKERFEVIIVDTSGRHKQESELFQEMVQIGEAVRPDMTVLVLDASIGQAAEAQAKAFKESANFGAIIVTKMDGHAKGGGAISAVAATKTPIIFLGVGEHLHDLDRFSPEPFISKLLGRGDIQGFVDHMQNVTMGNDPEKQKEIQKKIGEGKLSIGDWKEQMSNIMNMGPLSKIASMIPGMPQGMMDGSDEETSMRMKRMMIICDSMTQAELDSDGSSFIIYERPEKVSHKEKEKEKQLGKPVDINIKRLAKIARGAGTSVREVEEMLCQYRMMSNMAKTVGGKNGWLQNIQKMQQAAGGAGRGLGPNGMPTPSQIAAMQRSMPPGMLNQMRQSGSGLQDMMKAMMGPGTTDQDMAEMQAMMKQMASGIGGGGGGMGGMLSSMLGGAGRGR
ncbi:Signal recognition particle [Tulasnella sp. 332]|nr:Signal recognition particle [Tulasnella sp. 332]